MYGWGGSTSDWKKAGKYDWNSARKPYMDKLADDADKKGPRTYSRPLKPNEKLVNTNGKIIQTSSENPIVVAIDVTGSMKSWPAEIFDRLPLLYQTLSQYRPDTEICFAAIGDANCDQYPLQVNDFGKGLELEEKIRALYPEGGGGGQISESYELFAYYMLEKCNMPNAKSPFLLVYGDENFYDTISARQVEYYIGDKLASDPNSDSVWRKLLQKFDLYFLQKEYGDGDMRVTKEVNGRWATAIGEQRIISLPSAERAVDVAMALIAKKWGEFGDFKKNISARQDESERNAVYSSVRHVVDEIAGDNSVTVKAKSTTRKTKPLA